MFDRERNRLTSWEWGARPAEQKDNLRGPTPGTCENCDQKEFWGEGGEKIWLACSNQNTLEKRNQKQMSDAQARVACQPRRRSPQRLELEKGNQAEGEGRVEEKKDKKKKRGGRDRGTSKTGKETLLGLILQVAARRLVRKKGYREGTGVQRAQLGGREETTDASASTSTISLVAKGNSGKRKSKNIDRKKGGVIKGCRKKVRQGISL